MIALGALLLGLGVGDLVAGGLAGQPAARRWAGALASAVVATAVPALVGVSGVRAGATGIAVAIVTAAWHELRRPEEPSVARVWLALAVPLVGIALAVLAGPELLVTGSPTFANWAARHDVALLAGLDGGRLVLVSGVVVAQLGTANAIVRLVLIAAGPDVWRASTRLRGGRLIGPLERLLLFGLAATGQGTAAGFVVAAKSALRFPELASAGRADVAAGSREEPLERVDAATEYVLLGSLTSWTLALAPVLLL